VLTLQVLGRLYLPIVAAILFGVGISYGLALPVAQRLSRRPLAALAPKWVGQFLFWIGVPLGSISFLHRADLSSNVFLAPAIAWAAMLLGLLGSRLWLRAQPPWPRPSQGSLGLAAMLGNTGGIGYPVVLLLPQLGPDYFGWALFYDALGTLPGAYGLGVIIASLAGERPLPLLAPPPPAQTLWRTSLLEVSRNPTLIAFVAALLLRPVPFAPLLDQALYAIAWLGILLSLVLMGMRLQQITSWRALPPAAVVVLIKMLLVPAAIGLGLTLAGLGGPTRLVLVVQAAMPCAFATLILAEAYNLDRDLTVTCVGLSSAALMLTLPLWLWIFAP
jgi:malate permease and related proteins